jgi:hypothetical protein
MYQYFLIPMKIIRYKLLEKKMQSMKQLFGFQKIYLKKGDFSRLQLLPHDPFQVHFHEREIKGTYY